MELTALLMITTCIRYVQKYEELLNNMEYFYLRISFKGFILNTNYHINKEFDLREEFIKKKIVTNVIIRGGGPADKMLQFLKLCLKSISGHSESFW